MSEFPTPRRLPAGSKRSSASLRDPERSAADRTGRRAGSQSESATVRTARLLLEAVTPRSAAVLWRVKKSPHLRAYQDIQRFTREEFERHVASRPACLDGRTVGRFEWLIRERETEIPMGWVSLRVGEHERGVAEIGYGILMQYRGSGYASEATLAVLELAFRYTRNLRRIDARCLPANEPSCRLLARSGFAQPTLRRDGAFVHGRNVDVLIFELTRERWFALRRGDPSLAFPRH